MGDLNETISSAVEQAGDSRLNSIVALLVALAATLMALDNIKDGNIAQAMSQAQTLAIALLGLTALTRKRWLLGLTGLFLLVGLTFALAGFLGLGLHPDALMSWLS